MAYDPEEHRRLAVVLNSWVARKKAGAANLRKTIKKLKTKEEKYQVLLLNVVSAAPHNASEKFSPSKGNSVGDAKITKESWTQKIIRKPLKTKSMALKRTLSVYGFLRENNLDDEVAIAKLDVQNVSVAYRRQT